MEVELCNTAKHKWPGRPIPGQQYSASYS